MDKKQAYIDGITHLEQNLAKIRSLLADIGSLFKVSRDAFKDYQTRLLQLKTETMPDKVIEGIAICRGLLDHISDFSDKLVEASEKEEYTVEIEERDLDQFETEELQKETLIVLARKLQDINKDLLKLVHLEKEIKKHIISEKSLLSAMEQVAKGTVEEMKEKGQTFMGAALLGDIQKKIQQAQAEWAGGQFAADLESLMRLFEHILKETEKEEKLQKKEFKDIKRLFKLNRDLGAVQEDIDIIRRELPKLAG